MRDNSEWYCARPEVFDFEQMLKLSFVFSEGKHLFIASQPALNEDLLLKFRDNLWGFIFLKGVNH